MRRYHAAHRLPYESISLTYCFFSAEVNGTHCVNILLGLAWLDPICHGIYREPLINHRSRRCNEGPTNQPSLFRYHQVRITQCLHRRIIAAGCSPITHNRGIVHQSSWLRPRRNFCIKLYRTCLALATRSQTKSASILTIWHRNITIGSTPTVTFVPSLLALRISDTG